MQRKINCDPEMINMIELVDKNNKNIKIVILTLHILFCFVFYILYSYVQEARGRTSHVMQKHDRYKKDSIQISGDENQTI